MCSEYLGTEAGEREEIETVCEKAAKLQGEEKSRKSLPERRKIYMFPTYQSV